MRTVEIVPLTKLFTILLFIPMVSLANENIIRMVHGVQLDLCKHAEGCRASDIEHCEAETRGAFALCDTFLTQTPVSVPEFSTCMNAELTRRLGKKTVTKFMLVPECALSPTPSTASTPQLPRAAELPQYFTTVGLDIKSLALAHSAQEACSRSAVRQVEIVKNKNPNIHIDIRLTDPVKTQSINGTPEVGYSHLLKTSTYIYGKCTGKHITTFIHNDRQLGYTQGQQIVADYEPALYVVVDCKSMPKPAVCD